MSRLNVNIHEKKSTINKNIYGHFSEHLGRCIYDGIFVGENSEIPNKKGMRSDIVEALKNIKIPVLRWPGGCFADEYHWKDGIGPVEHRKNMVNTHWGKVVEDNSFGTHEFMELCEQLGCEPYINGNVGSGTVQEMQEWVEYLTFDGISPMTKLREENGRKEPWKVKYWGVGNENWGCGGNMTPDYYAGVYRHFQTYLRGFGDNVLYKIACGSHQKFFEWTEKVMELAGQYMNALTLHYYTLPTNDWTASKGSATQFDNDMYYKTLSHALKMDEIITGHLQIMSKYDPEHKVGMIVDEWGTWYDVEPGTNPGYLYQQNTMRDAIVASTTLDIFNKHSDRVVMANIAQLINVLQAMILTEGEKMLLTPTYHVFDLYKNHHDATLLGHWLECGISDEDSGVPHLSSTASTKDNQVTITITNLSATESADVTIAIPDVDCTNAKGRILTGSIDSFNDFDNPDNVVIESFNDIKCKPDSLNIKLPACSVAELVVDA
ncbi:MAG: alpha-N-arabinofuranosidase [Oscillospiraceae bacterium]|nr:alpha-N-arabinofuranosidase [Oscillospiraceae bacterium]